MMSKLGQFTGFHFTDLNPYSYDINNMKLDLSVSTKVKFNAIEQDLYFQNQENDRFILKVLSCIF